MHSGILHPGIHKCPSKKRNGTNSTGKFPAPVGFRFCGMSLVLTGFITILSGGVAVSTSDYSKPTHIDRGVKNTNVDNYLYGFADNVITTCQLCIAGRKLT